MLWHRGSTRSCDPEMSPSFDTIDSTFDHDAVGMTGCQLWQSNEVFGLSMQSSR